MKQKLLKTLVAFLAIAAAAAGPAWGQNASPDVTLDFTTNDWGLPSSKANKAYDANSYTSGDYTITLQGGGGSSNGYYFNSGYLLLGKSGAYLQLPEFESAVDSIQVVGPSGASGSVLQNVYVDDNNSWVAVSTQTGARGTNTYVIDEDYRAAGNIYTLKVDNAYNTQITYIKVYYVSSGGGSGSETPTPGQNENLLTTVTPTSLTTYEETTPGVVTVTLDGQLEYDNNDGWKAEYGNGNQGSVTVTATPGFSIDSCKFYVYYNSSYQDSYTVTAAPFAVYPYCHGSMGKVFTQPNAQGIELGYGGVKRIEVYGTVLPPQPHTVQLAAGTEEAANWTLASGNASVPGTQVLEGILAGTPLTATYNGDLKIKEVIATKHVAPVPVQSIVLDKQTAFLGKDSTMTLSVASVLPENAADKSYTWSSDNTSVATVNATTGVATGMDAGTANIIATANDGSGAADTCVVTVLRSAILDGVPVLYASDYDSENWSTVIGYNPGVMYQDDDNVRLTSNGAFLYHDGNPVYVLDNFYTGSNGYQWMLVTNINGSKIYYRQGETWQQAINANRMNNDMWSIEGGQVKFLMQTLVDSNYQPIDPTATIDPSTVNYYLWDLN